ncbi:MAG TPA: type II secretion system protein [Acidimicrobiales bacterium]|nr:type II secretion system protein [Acidimicrobiales bacterium]
MKRMRNERGFTLIELLVVIVILGILAAVVVFAVSGLSDKGQDSACKIDKRTLATSEEASFAKDGGYRSEADLVSAGLLDAESDYHDITLTGTSPAATAYTISAATTGPKAGKCA